MQFHGVLLSARHETLIARYFVDVGYFFDFFFLDRFLVAFSAAGLAALAFFFPKARSQPAAYFCELPVRTTLIVR